MTSEVRVLNTLIKDDFNLSEDLVASNSKYEDLFKALTELVSHLLNNDFNKLIGLFYRIDLDEEKVKMILANTNIDDISQKLAELIITRQLKKLKTRKMYHSKDYS